MSYLDFVGSLPCLVARCPHPAQPHHVRTKGAVGHIDERNVVPLCAHHHTGGAGVHYLGRRTWAKRFQLCLPAEALLVYVRWLNYSGSAAYHPTDFT